MSRATKAIYFIAVALALNTLGCSDSAPKVAAEVNQGASLTGNLPANPLQWEIITSTIDQGDSTMATLYGNDPAVEYARTHSQHDYPAGAVLSLVTWTEREDPRWFGAKIPDRVKSVEFLTVRSAPDGHPSYSYQDFEGSPLQQISALQTPNPQGRAAYLLSQRAAVLP